MAENPPSEYVPNGQGQQAQPPVPQQPVPPQFPGGGTEAPYRAYVPASRKTNWTLAIVWTVGLLLAIPALFLFIGIFAWASGMYR